jgi:hypothetical protein
MQGEVFCLNRYQYLKHLKNNFFKKDRKNQCFFQMGVEKRKERWYTDFI